MREIGGRYLLSDELGRGGMGTVWRAHDRVLDRAVALKEVAMPPWVAGADRERAYERVLREARATARLRHPGVITIHDVVLDGGRPWIVMELLAAESLADLLVRAGPVPELAVAEIGLKLLEALRAAHEAGITHRDVKPGNVLLVKDGGVVLSDFGIAHVADSATLTASGMLMGSPAYLAPERIEGQAAGPGSDLWALGATLYSAVEGAAPFQGPTPVALLANILMHEARPMRLAQRTKPVIEGLMSKDPAQRLDAGQAMAALVRAGAGHGRMRAGSPALAALVRQSPPEQQSPNLDDTRPGPERQWGDSS